LPADERTALLNLDTIACITLSTLQNLLSDIESAIPKHRLVTQNETDKKMIFFGLHIANLIIFRRRISVVKLASSDDC